MAPLRFGPRPELFPHARGNLVEGTFCERVFSGCSRNNPCYVQGRNSIDILRISPKLSLIIVIMFGYLRTVCT